MTFGILVLFILRVAIPPDSDSAKFWLCAVKRKSKAVDLPFHGDFRNAKKHFTIPACRPVGSEFEDDWAFYACRSGVEGDQRKKETFDRCASGRYCRDRPRS